jgi:hypothetical protein
MLNGVPSLFDVAAHVRQFFKLTQLGGIFRYRSANLTELQGLRGIYNHIFVRQDELAERATTSTAIVSTVARPVHLFDLDPTGTKPRATNDEIRNCFFLRTTDVAGELFTPCRAAFDLLQYAAAKRLEACGTTYEQVNSAIILFTAEFLSWLDKLANLTEYDKNTYAEVSARIEYLEMILESRVFPDEARNSDYGINKIIVATMQTLEQVLPTIEWYIKQESSREHFGGLIGQVNNYLSSTINALFCLYTAVTDADVFDISNYKNQQIIHSIREALGSRFGGLVVILGDACQSVIHLGSTKSNTNLFLDDNGGPRPECVANLQNRDPPGSGVHPIMSQTNLLEELVKQFGCLRDCSLFLQAFRRAYLLSGEIGDVGVYLHLAREVLALIAIYPSLISVQQKSLQIIMEFATQKFIRCETEGSNDGWRKNYLSFKKKVRVAGKFLQQIQDSLGKLSVAMQAARTGEMKDNVIRDIQGLQKIVRQICARNLRGFDSSLLLATPSSASSSQPPLPLPQMQRQILDSPPSPPPSPTATTQSPVFLSAQKQQQFMASKTTPIAGVREGVIPTPQPQQAPASATSTPKKGTNRAEEQALILAILKDAEEQKRREEMAKTSSSTGGASRLENGGGSYKHTP